MRFFVGFFCRPTCLSCTCLLRERLAAKARSLVHVELFGCDFSVICLVVSVVSF